MVFGWRAGCGRMASKPVFTRRASPCRASIGGRWTGSRHRAAQGQAFLGWLRGEPGHYGMVAIPTLEEEDAKRPNREPGEPDRRAHPHHQPDRGCLARLGVRNFEPTLRKAPGRLETLRTPEGVTLPPNTLAELRRDMARLRFVTGQITEIEQARLERLRRAPDERPHAMVQLLARDRRRHRDGGHAGARGPLARPAGPKGGGPLRRPDGLAGGERRQAAGEGALQGGQRARAPRHDPARLAFSPVPGGQRSWRSGTGRGQRTLAAARARP